MKVVKTINIKELEAKPGEKAFGFVDVADTFGSISQLPVGIINGSQPGPTLLVTAGIHACEYTGIEAPSRLYKKTMPDELKGALIIITCMNIPALRMRKPFVVPFDDKNLNRSFPGSSTGSAAEIIADFVMKEFLPKADSVLDLHAGDIGEKLFSLTICNQTDDDELTEKSKALAAAAGLDYSYLSDVRSNDDGKWISSANKAGIPAIVIEIGYDGGCEEKDVLTFEMVLQNIMKYISMVPGQIQRESDREKTAYFKSLIPIKTQSTGIFHPLIEIRETVSEGQKIGIITDLKGDVVEELKSSADSLLLMLAAKRVVNAGDGVLYLCQPE